MTTNILTAIQNATGIDALADAIRQAVQLGRSSYVVTVKGAEVKTAFKIVDASDLVVSNNGDGTINPAYPAELQPRDRTRLASKLQVNSIANSLRPAQLTDSGMSSHGAPIVGADNVVESGNGRTMGIVKAYGTGNADHYRQFLVEHARDYGLDPAAVAAMKAPVLVRERLTDVDRAQFAKDSNISDLQEMAASEKAFADAESITPDMMKLFNPSDSGDLLSKSNSAFIQAFMQQIGATAAAGLLTADGRPTRQLLDRIQNAIFAKAYKDDRLVRMVAEEPDPDMRNVLTALNTAANDFANMQMLSGEAHKDAVTDLVDGIESVNGLDKQALDAIQGAIELVRQAKDSGQAIQEVIAQQGMFEQATPQAQSLALFIAENNRSAKRIGRAFKLMAEAINDELTRSQHAMADMFGGGEIDISDVLNQVSQQIESEFGEGKGLGGDLF